MCLGQVGEGVILGSGSGVGQTITSFFCLSVLLRCCRRRTRIDSTVLPSQHVNSEQRAPNGHGAHRCTSKERESEKEKKSRCITTRNKNEGSFVVGKINNARSQFSLFAIPSLYYFLIDKTGSTLIVPMAISVDPLASALAPVLVTQTQALQPTLAPNPPYVCGRRYAAGRPCCG